VVLMCALLIWRHKENITKLINGTESKLGTKKAAPTAAEAVADAAVEDEKK
jgi:acyl phosphate:glycerol-3-phosphate acyltransferase